MHTPHIHIEDVGLAYHGHLLFSHLTLDLPPGQWTGLLGPSGVGKTSLLRLIAGLTTNQETIQGRIEADNQKPVKEQIAYMAQTDLLLPWLNVLQNATLGLRLRNHSRQECHALQTKALSLLEQVGLSKAAHLFPSQLSGGMRQRVALVRTLMENKPLVLMDEPFSALDAITRYKLQNLAVTLLQDKTVLFITHDPSEALRLAHVIYIMQGQPATLKPLTRLTSSIPRGLNDEDVLARQSSLYHELTEACGDNP